MKTKNKVNKKNTKNRNLFGNKLLISILLFSTVFCVVYVAFIKKEKTRRKEKIIREINNKMEKGDVILREKNIRNIPYTDSETYATDFYKLTLADDSKLRFRTETDDNGNKYTGLVPIDFGSYPDQKMTITNIRDFDINLNFNANTSQYYQFKRNTDSEAVKEINLNIAAGASVNIFIVFKSNGSVGKKKKCICYWSIHISRNRKNNSVGGRRSLLARQRDPDGLRPQFR